MWNYSEKRTLIYTPEQMFDLVADVENYAKFLPGWLDARIRKREGDLLLVDQEVGMGLYRIRFGTRCFLRRPERIEISATRGPFRRLSVRWRFEPGRQGGCVANFYAELELHSKFIEKVIGTIFKDLIRRIVVAFERRARWTYGSE